MVLVSCLREDQLGVLESDPVAKLSSPPTSVWNNRQRMWKAMCSRVDQDQDGWAAQPLRQIAKCRQPSSQ